MNEKANAEQKAVIVVDMQKDNVGEFCRAIIPNIKLLMKEARNRGVPIIFACDSRYPEDFVFTRTGHPPRTIRGTEGVKVIEQLDPRPTDIIVEKRMLSGFFGSDLDFTLRQKGTKRLIVTGVSTWACILKTAFDAVELGYDVLVPADCCASPSLEAHDSALKLFKQMGILKMSVKEVIETL